MAEIIKTIRTEPVRAGISCPGLKQFVQEPVMQGTLGLMMEKLLRVFPLQGHIVNQLGQQDDFVTLSDREREVLACIARGLSSKQCAQELEIAPRTVERHVENLRNKLNARNKPHLVAKALAGGHI